MVRRTLEHWFEAEAIRPQIVAECDDSALTKDFGEQGRAWVSSPSPRSSRRRSSSTTTYGWWALAGGQAAILCHLGRAEDQTSRGVGDLPVRAAGYLRQGALTRARPNALDLRFGHGLLLAMGLRNGNASSGRDRSAVAAVRRACSRMGSGEENRAKVKFAPAWAPRAWA